MRTKRPSNFLRLTAGVSEESSSAGGSMRNDTHHFDRQRKSLLYKTSTSKASTPVAPGTPLMCLTTASSLPAERAHSVGRQGSSSTSGLALLTRLPLSDS